MGEVGFKDFTTGIAPHTCVYTPHIMWLDAMQADRVQRMRGEERIQEGVMGGVDHTSADAIITKYDLH